MAALHHLELLVRDGLRFVRQMSEQYSLRAFARRETTFASQWVLGSGAATFVITEPKTVRSGQFPGEHVGLQLQQEKLHRGIDTVFDVAVCVKDVDRILKNVAALGGEVLLPKTVYRSDNGTCEMAVIKSCTGNVVHTLVNRESYRDSFLPGFSSICDNDNNDDPTEMVHIKRIDHVTIVCRRGDLDRVLNWYQNVFGFSRFFMNRSEDEDEGFVLDGEIGLRLKAMEYFKCAETMLSSDPSDETALRLVIAESMPGHGS
ncbi:4-hydroxyphenylpyruvate dioxygenase-like protein isoform X2 [Paramacrobiotus metropolitanus]|uniref:4-hydroxyphenylpyruvate dioxygenase-like protein isoform X2 n=1 Tax=Paramacrobiotus metropolitanus TaxID=2943436 RepID=UPI0024456101|nr:4-hydroxyphenylpyruvate dioxygenase-like protein isoform X2 [Paramacrobiotus metropolitanus]